MEPLALKDKDVLPTTEVLCTILKNSFPAYEQLEKELADAGIQIEWRYYNDGKAWLGKLMNKKKNLGWLHVYHEFFTVTCFFMERHLDAIAHSDIPQKVKENFMQQVFDSKLKPMNIAIRSANQLVDVHILLRFKNGLK